MANWTTTLLGDVLPFRYGKNLPADSRTHSGEFSVVSSAGVIDSHNEALVDEPSIVIGRKGSVGSLTFCPDPVWPTDTAFYAVGSQDIDIRFAFYLLHTLPLSDMNNDSAVPGLNRNDAAAVPIRIPEISYQRRVAAVLGSLDDKIAANGEVLDAADRLIRESFRILQKDGQLTLGDICAHDRTTIAPDNFPNTGIYVGLEHFDSPKIWVSRHGSISDVTSTKSAFQNGDTLFSKLRPYFHKVGVAPSGGICSTDILVLRAARSEWRNFVLAAASSDEVVEAAVQNSNGTRMPRAKWTDIAGCAIPDPTTAESRRFIELADGLVPKCIGLMNENETLARTRDELLPLLMSGQITVAGASRSGAGAGIEGLSEGMN